MGVVLGGENARFQRVSGPFVVSYQYVNDEPAMVIWPARRPSLGSAAFIICMDAAWKYADSKTGNPTPYCVLQCMKALELMGLFVAKADVKKLADIIVDGLPDLLRLKPGPRETGHARAPVVGEAEFKADGKTVSGGEVEAPRASELDDYVPSGAH